MSPRREAALEQEFAEVYRAHERMLADAGARDEGDLMRDALRAAADQPAIGRRFDHVLIDDAQELDLAAVDWRLRSRARRGRD